MNIRPFRDGEEGALIALWQESKLATPQNDSKKDIERKLKVDPDLLLVAVQEKRIVGSVMGGYDGHRGWINYLAVSPDRRRQGIASKLMQSVEAALLLKGCPKINLQVRNANADALAFYSARGYLEDQVVGLGKRLIYDNL